MVLIAPSPQDKTHEPPPGKLVISSPNSWQEQCVTCSLYLPYEQPTRHGCILRKEQELDQKQAKFGASDERSQHCTWTSRSRSSSHLSSSQRGSTLLCLGVFCGVLSFASSLALFPCPSHLALACTLSRLIGFTTVEVALLAGSDADGLGGRLLEVPVDVVVTTRRILL